MSVSEQFGLHNFAEDAKGGGFEWKRTFKPLKA